jgi:hypothetical protein
MLTCPRYSQVRIVIDKFGIAAIRNAWYNSSQVTEHVLYGYTKVIILIAPSLCLSLLSTHLILESLLLTWMLMSNAALED